MMEGVPQYKLARVILVMKNDETETEIRIYRFFFAHGNTYGKVLKFCPFCGKKPQII